MNIAGAQQIILEKVKLDLFTNPNIQQLLDKLQADHYVVYGVVTEYCVKCAAMGLLATGKPVTLITDAIETLNPRGLGCDDGGVHEARGRLAISSKLLPSERIPGSRISRSSRRRAQA